MFTLVHKLLLHHDCGLYIYTGYIDCNFIYDCLFLYMWIDSATLMSYGCTKGHIYTAMKMTCINHSLVVNHSLSFKIYAPERFTCRKHQITHIINIPLRVHSHWRPGSSKSRRLSCSFTACVNTEIQPIKAVHMPQTYEKLNSVTLSVFFFVCFFLNADNYYITIIISEILH